ncbi:hypothetical protein HY212_06785 [Candidatus Pacearchaeota archaeon]|nr:hypothetical protein [Candidatus Pacearchaeota archaeon]
MTLEKKGLNLLVVLVALFLVLSSNTSALAGSIGNARMVLYPEVNGKDAVSITKSILVKNINNVTINVSLQIDNDTAKFIEIVDKKFQLEPNTEKKASFIVKVSKEGNYEGKIIVLFSPVSGKEAGVALPSTIVVIAKKNQGYTDTGENAVDANVSDGNANDQNQNATISGEAVGKGNKKLNPAIFLVIMTTILLIVLVFLISIISRKGKRRNGNGSRKRNEK